MNIATRAQGYKKPPVHAPLAGIACALAAFMMFAFMNMFAKLLSENHHVIEIAFYRNLIALMPFALFVWWRGGLKTIKPVNKKGVYARAVLGIISLIVTFAAFAAMPMADVTAFLFTTSLFIPVLSILFLGEHVGLHRWTAIIIGFIGVLVMLQPSGNTNMVGVVLALSAAMMHAIMGVLLRYIGRTDAPVTVTFYFIFFGTVITLPAMPFLYVPPTITELFYILGIGFSGAFAQLFLATAFKHVEASVVTVFNYSGIIWATVIGYMVWGDLPGYAIVTGGTIVIGSNLYIVWRERQLRQSGQKKSATRTPPADM